MIIQVFPSSMVFPCMELFLVVFHDFQSLREPCNQLCPILQILTLHDMISKEFYFKNMIRDETRKIV